MQPRRIALISSASGNGKTTLGHRLATHLGVPFVELDALVHGPGWVETPDDELRATLAPTLVADGWVIDGAYTHKLGNRVLDAADLVIWLDLPLRVWLSRLIRRSWRRLRGAEELWNGNRESLHGLVWGWESLFGYALRTHFRRRREWPERFRGYPLVRVRTVAEVERLIGELEGSAGQGPGWVHLDVDLGQVGAPLE